MYFWPILPFTKESKRDIFSMDKIGRSRALGQQIVLQQPLGASHADPAERNHREKNLS